MSPETCDNVDNNCNGCTDEGFTHYADVQPWRRTVASGPPMRSGPTCLTNYKATITAANPLGNRNLLPCTTAAQQTDPTHWLCFDPGEKCDSVDNNGVGTGSPLVTVDEGVTKCGSPLHCPTTEVCNGQDDNCDGTSTKAASVAFVRLLGPRFATASTIIVTGRLTRVCRRCRVVWQRLPTVSERHRVWAALIAFAIIIRRPRPATGSTITATV